MKIAFRQYLDLLIKYLAPQRLKVLAITLLLLSSTGLMLADPQFLRYIIDMAIAGRVSFSLIGTIFLYLVVVLAAQIASVFAAYFSADVAWTSTNALRRDVARYCLYLDMSFHNVHTPGEMIERLDGDVTVLANFFSQMVVQIIGSILLLLGVLVLLFLVDWRVGLALALFAIIDVVVVRRLRTAAVPSLVSARQRSAEFYGFLEERLTGTEDIRSCGASQYILQRFTRLVRQRLHSEYKAGFMTSTTLNINVVLVALGRALGFALGAWLFLSHAITIGTVYLIVSYISFLTNPIDTVMQQVGDLQKVEASIGRLQELYKTERLVLDGEEASRPEGIPSIEFQNVSFRYSGQEPVLHSLSFELQAGEVLGIVGRTGSGKTSLTRLLFRLYDPQQGVILLGGRDIRCLQLTALRQRVGLVTQDIQLFHATIRDNLTFFNDHIDDARILTVLKDLGLWEWYSSLPGGLDTELGGDKELSAGQAQLLALARVFLKEPDVIILDEASSRLDPATERAIEQAIDKLLCNRTAIVIAHRLATINRADKILVLEHGQITEFGERDLLISNPSSRFYQLLQANLVEGVLA